MKELTAKEAKKVDDLAINDYGISGLILMENAGRGLYDIAKSMTSSEDEVICVCGKGNNGGDGLVASRHLFNNGFKVSIFLLGELSDFSQDARINYEIAKKIGIDFFSLSSDDDFSFLKEKVLSTSLVIDAIFGIGLSKEIKGGYLKAINQINESNTPVLSADIPSGLDATEGFVLGACIKAKKTAAFGYLKSGLSRNDGPNYCGEISVVDISLPKNII